MELIQDMVARYLPALRVTMSPDNEQRIQGEQQLQNWKIEHDLYPMVLACVATAWQGLQVELSVRQLSAVLLRRFMDQHWDSSCEHGHEKVIPDAYKEQLLEIMLPSLSEMDDKIRDANANVVAVIAHHELHLFKSRILPVLLSHLEECKDAPTRGALVVLEEVTEMLAVENDDFMLCLPNILPKMVKIVAGQQSGECKIAALKCMASCINQIVPYMQVRKGVDKKIIEAADRYFPANFMTSIVKLCLQQLQNPAWDAESCGVKRQMMSFLTSTLMYRSSSEPNSSERVVNIMQVTWQLLKEAKEPYMKGFIRNDSADTSDKCSVYHFVLSILHFMEEVFECGQYNKLVNKSMAEMVALLVFFIQLTDSEVEQYLSRPEDLVEDDGEMTVRAQCMHILENPCDFLQLNRSFKTAIFAVLQEQIKAAHDMKASGDCNWWKLMEACYFVISTKQDTMLKCVGKTVSQEDILALLRNFVIPDMNSDLPLLAARATLVCSCFCSLLPERDCAELVDLLLPNISPDDSKEILRIFSVRAVYNMFDKHTTEAEMLEQRLPAAFQACLSCLHSVDGALLEHLVELLATLVRRNPAVADLYGVQMMRSLLHLIRPRAHDIILKSQLNIVFNSVGQHGVCTEAIKQEWLPYIAHVLTNDEDHYDQVEMALDMLTCVARHARDPFNKVLLDTCFPALLKRLSIAADSDATLFFDLCECVRAFTRSSAAHLREARFDGQTSGVEIILGLVRDLLGPRFVERHSILPARLISSFLLAFNDCLSHEQLDEVLKLTLIKMSRTQLPSEFESLLSVFIHLFASNAPAAVQYLESVGVIEGVNQPPLEYVVSSMCERHHYFFVRYDVRASTVACCRLLEFVLASKHSKLAAMQVRGAEIHSDGVRTRSKKTERKYGSLPLVAKLYKIAVGSIQQHYEQKDAEDDEFYETDDEEEEDDDDDDSDQGVSFLDDSDFFAEDEADDDEEEDDVVDSSLVKLDLHEHVGGLVRQLASHQQVHQQLFLPHLSKQERTTLERFLDGK